ncbi:MAG: hypothetical protein FD177_313 [Desulfovibrionaceae bacterium]|nr:MAG: hypothetical protein FD177_313 [Desulfovibrionaceae bacterium]
MRFALLIFLGVIISAINLVLPVTVFCNEHSYAQQVIVDLIAQEEPLNADLNGFGGIETFKGSSVRWANGPVAEIRFISSADKHVEIDIACASPFSGQSIEIIANGEAIANLSLSKAIVLPDQFEYKTTFKLRKGENVVRLRFDKWNEGDNTFAPADTRTMAALLSRFRIIGPVTQTTNREHKKQANISNCLTDLTTALRPPQVFNLLKTPDSQYIQLVGLAPEHQHIEGRTRSAYGPNTRAVIIGKGHEKVRIDFSLRSEIEGQGVRILLNGYLIESFDLNPALTGRSIEFILRRGLNELSINYYRSETVVEAPYPFMGRPSSVYQTFMLTLTPDGPPSQG